jgi:transposase-like protein
MATAASTSHRVIYHEPICPTCGSSNITTDDIDIVDGLTETAYVCLACGETWPLACVTDWGGAP